MPAQQDHIHKADRNSGLAISMTLDSPAKIDWALVILFYSAMHYVEAYLAGLGQHLRSHTTRDAYIGREAQLRTIYVEYSDLKYYAYNARYEMAEFAQSDVAAAVASLATVKSHISSIL
ncbi:MAG: hypothetical protein ABI806_15870 [Candidatus Solibacter sp.]